ncbi:MAG: helix-turn-helix domain-containing protein [Desulfobacteraceae bacterium]|nr:helix-turn-helix domain-containing protein [Desulfobacteraceae bacterium]MBC2748910.1 helix-turn-helix domain-containing protein [Desulfobacteraceae bacterium]
MTVQREYFKVSELAKYAGISERTLWELLKDPINPIPFFRVGAAGRMIRIKKSDFDRWMRSHQVLDSAQIDQLAEELLN